MCGCDSVARSQRPVLETLGRDWSRLISQWSYLNGQGPTLSLADLPCAHAVARSCSVTSAQRRLVEHGAGSLPTQECLAIHFGLSDSDTSVTG